MKNKATEPNIHLDRLGRELALDDVVAFSASNSLRIGKIIKVNPKMLKVVPLERGRHRDRLIYPMDCIRIDEAEATVYILKNMG
jgi:hypothetical protein